MSGAGSAVSQEGTGGRQAGRKARVEDRTPRFEMSEDCGWAAVSAGTEAAQDAGRQDARRGERLQGRALCTGKDSTVAVRGRRPPRLSPGPFPPGKPPSAAAPCTRTPAFGEHFTGKGFEALQAEDGPRSHGDWDSA